MKSFLDWSDYKDAGMGDPYAGIPKQGGDFAKAVAVCISSHQCETLDKGVMCPSYRVTQNPDLTPGGRVRLLKKALNSDAPDALVTDPLLAQSMALCLGCKGCKRECENSVDLAQIKIEYLAQSHAVHPVSLRTRLFAHLPRWLHTWPLLGRLSALQGRSKAVQYLTRTFLGLAKRSFPVTAPQAFEDSRSTTETTPAEEKAPKKMPVVLFIDTYSRYYQPEIAQAGLQLLEAAGCHVQLVQPANPGERPLCCGRTYLAQGLVAPAKEEAARVLEALLPWVESGYTVVGLEPSCLLALRDDYRALGLGEAAEKVSRSAWLLEEFLVKQLRNKALALQWTPNPDQTPLLVHGHCHQKAVGAMKSMRKLLALLPETPVELIESSCCGLGGSFGYEQEHQALSDAMAEAALLPALRQQPEAVWLANGFSCRQQILSHTGRRPQHLVEVLRDRLAAPESLTVAK